MTIVLLGTALAPRAFAQATATFTPTATATPQPCCQVVGSLTNSSEPAGMVIDYGLNRLYVSCLGDQVSVYDSNNAIPITVFSSLGSSGTLNYPIDVAVDPQHNIYVADLDNKAVEKFDDNYNFLCAIQNSPAMQPTGVWADGASVYVSVINPSYVCQFTGSGTSYSAAATLGLGALNNPDGLVEVGPWLYVTDTYNNQVVKFATGSPSAPPVTVWTPLLQPAGIRTDLAGHFYVTEGNNGGTPEYSDIFNPGFNSLLDQCPQTGSPWGVAVNASGKVFVSGINTDTVNELQGCVVEPTVTPSYGGSNPPGPGQCFIYPSPARGNQASVSYDMAQSGTVQLKVWNWKGGAVGQVTDQKTAGVQVTPFDISNLATGVYFYDLTLTYASGQVVTIPPQKFVILH